MEIRLHKTSTTTPRTRKYIQESDKSNAALSRELGINIKTVIKWRSRKETYDLSHTRHNLHITLSVLEEEIIKYLRCSFFLGVDDITYIMQQCIRDSIKEGAVYRCLKRHGINRKSNIVNKDNNLDRLKYGKFNEEDNRVGFIQIDVKYIYKGRGSKFKIHGGDGKYYFLYVAIDRSTRHVFVKLEKDLSSKTAALFLKEVEEKFPHKIRVVLTDNGTEFTDKFNDDKINKPKGQPSGDHEFDKLCSKLNIERRYIKPGKPQTNGMVERFNRRIAEYMRTKPKEISSFDEIKNFIYNFANNYNNTKLKVINYHTPRNLLHDQYHEDDNT